MQPETEWELADWAFTKINNTLGIPEIDLFATTANTKCRKFVSWRKDPNSIAINAFTISWKNLVFYAFPPFSLILKTLRKIIDDKAQGIVVAPIWPTQPGFPLFESLTISLIIKLGPNSNLLTSFSSKQHPLAQNFL